MSYFNFLLFSISLSVCLTLVTVTSILFSLSSIIGCLIVLSWISWQITIYLNRYIFPNAQLNPLGKAILITGCDSGFGYQTAIELQRKGWQVFASVLNDKSESSKLLKEIGCFVVAFNVIKESEIESGFELVSNECKKHNLFLWAIVNNAGVIVSGEIEWGDLNTQLEQVLDINVLGTVRVTRIFLPLIKKSKGRIINVSSVAGFITAPGVVYYSMSKHSITSFTDGLRRELYNTGIKVIEITPDVYKTPMTSKVMIANLDRCWERTSGTIQNETGESYFQSVKAYIKHNLDIARDKPQEVIDAIIDAATLQTVSCKYICTSFKNMIIIWIFKLLPDEWMDLLVSQFTSKSTPHWAQSRIKSQ